jgi:hypothetical protein
MACGGRKEKGRVQKHIELLGTLHIVYSVLGALLGVGAFAVLFGVGWAVNDSTALSILGIIGFLAAAFFLVVAVPGIIAGIGLLRLRPWSRVLAIVMGCLHMLSVPLGTALGVYTLWVLLNDDAIRILSSATVTTSPEKR